MHSIKTLYEMKLVRRSRDQHRHNTTSASCNPAKSVTFCTAHQIMVNSRNTCLIQTLLLSSNTRFICLVDNCFCLFSLYASILILLLMIMNIHTLISVELRTKLFDYIRISLSALPRVHRVCVVGISHTSKLPPKFNYFYYVLHHRK